jgi:hypothetical protein
VKKGFWKVKSKISEWTSANKTNQDVEIDHEISDCESEDNADDADHGADGANYGLDYDSD